MIRIWDGFLSLLAAVLASAVTGVPAFGAFLSIRDGQLAAWAWAPLIGLALVGIVMVLAFLRKAGRGVHPMRDRRR